MVGGHFRSKSFHFNFLVSSVVGVVGVEGVGDSTDVVAAVEGIESKTGGDEGLAGQSWVLPCRRQYVPPSDISPSPRPRTRRRNVVRGD